MIQQEILVAINCLTYNHEPYIRQCLEGFVTQKTKFRFVAIVHDDASTDNTAKIVREYADKYPDIIKPIFETVNQYSKKDGSLDRIIKQAINETNCKYIAVCEGDDYWTDPFKLQKQIDFLENNPEYTMCFHNAIEHYEKNIGGENIKDKIFSRISDKDYTGTSLLRHWIVPTASIVYRKSILDTDIYKRSIANKNFIYGDILLILSCAERGKVRGISDIMSVYRRHEGGVTIINEHTDITDNLVIHYLDIPYYFGKHYETIVKEKVVFALLREWRLSKIKNKSYLIKSFRYSPLLTIKVIIELLAKKCHTI